MATYICIRPRRARCLVCATEPTTTQVLEWYDQRSPHTKAYDRYLLKQLVVYAQDVKGTLWSLRKNHQDLDEAERIRLRRLFQYAPCLHQAYTLREELTAIFNRAQTTQEAERRLTSWIKKAKQVNATCFRPFVKTLTSHWTRIINYFADRVTSGFVEGLNNKIRTITRRCYGIRKPSTLFQRLWLDLEARLFYATKRPSTLSTT
jgi:hypothetical protein